MKTFFPGFRPKFNVISVPEQMSLTERQSRSRSCDGYQGCCVLPQIEAKAEAEGARVYASLGLEFKPYPKDKPFNVECEHCTGSGCAIYEDRPSLCQDWQCLYLRGLTPPDAHPKETGMVWAFEAERDPRVQAKGMQVMVAGYCADAEKQLSNPKVHAQILAFMETGMAVVVRGPKNVRRYCNFTGYKMVDVDPNCPNNSTPLIQTERVCDIPLLSPQEITNQLGE